MLVNIYLTKDEKQKLNLMSRKYEVSISTICENLLFYFTKYALFKNKTLCMSIGKEYKYNENGTKTSIKPKENPTNKELYGNYTKAYTNVVKIYLKKHLNNYMENAEEFYNDLNKKLQKLNEPNWDYNHFVRSMKRYETKRTQTR